MTVVATDRHEGSGQYEIRVRGHLATRWASRFDGFTFTHADNGTTVLTGYVADQAALHGTLRILADLGLSLLSVTPVISSTADVPTADHFKESAMTTATYTAPSPVQTAKGTAGRGMDPMRKVALAGGVMYLITFIASFPQLKLFADVIDDPAGFISGRSSNTSVLWGSWLEVVTAAACIGTAVALYPVTRRVSRTAGIGFVTSRVVEATLIVVGVVSMLSVVTLKAHFAGATGAQADSLRVTGEALVAMRQWTFLLGPGLVAGVNALFLGYVMYHGRLVPRAIPIIGLIGAPLILMSATSTILGGWEQTSAAGFLCALPIAVWEFSLGVYLTVKGFKRVPAVSVD